MTSALTGFRYATLKTGGSEVGGIGELDSGARRRRGALVGLLRGQDTDAAVATVPASADRVRPAWDSPYGRIAIVADPSGAVFSLISAPSES